MRSRRSLTSLFAAAAAACLAFTAAPAAHGADSPAAAGKYVALGDSYAVAPGTRTYDNPDDPCRRGPLAYPRLWAQQHAGSYSFVEASCSGATTADLRSQQVPQLTADTTLVTVQVGGNDVGFVDVLKNCILTINDKDCIAGVEAAKAAATTSLPGALANTYSAVRQKAPNAKVVVVGYPRMYTIGGTCGILGLSDAERTALNSAADTLDGVLAQQASNAGFTFLDPRSAFDPHSICSSGNTWVNSLEWDKINESYHPNQAGHRDGYLALLNAITG